MEKEFDTFEDAYQCADANPGSKLRYIAAIAKWVVTIAATTAIAIVIL